MVRNKKNYERLRKGIAVNCLGETFSKNLIHQNVESVSIDIIDRVQSFCNYTNSFSSVTQSRKIAKSDRKCDLLYKFVISPKHHNIFFHMHNNSINAHNSLII